MNRSVNAADFGLSEEAVANMPTEIAVEMTEKQLIEMLNGAPDPHELKPCEPVDTATLDIQIRCNVTDETFLQNVRINGVRMDVPWLSVVPEHLEHAVMVGGGPSLEISLHEVAARAHLGQTIVGLNGAAKYLKDRHIRVDMQVIIDCRPDCIKFVKPLAASRYLLSSGCDPSLFDFLVEHGADVTMFHMAHEGISEALPKGRHVVMVGGHYTVGLVAMAAMTVLGFRTMQLYGYDSSMSDDGRAHVYQQSETPEEADRIKIICAGREFLTSWTMFKQAEMFPKFAANLTSFGCTLVVHGEGLLPTVARELATPEGGPSDACYNMTNGPASFDFITWLVNAEMDRKRRGAPAPLRVAFVPGPEEGFRPADVQNVPEKVQILENVMRPALELFGAVEAEDAVNGRQFHYWYRPITDASRIGEEVPRCKPPVESVLDVKGWMIKQGIFEKDALVITLRETRYTQERNSNLVAWTKFAKKRQDEGFRVIFVRDTLKADERLDNFLIYPLAARDLHIRTALYSLAKCNLTIATGAAELLQFSDYPFIEFKPPSIDPMRPISFAISWWQRFGGITPPESFPWLGKHQLTVWQRDTVENIEAAWLRWRAAN
jgi:hypothetical protein